MKCKRVHYRFKKQSTMNYKCFSQFCYCILHVICCAALPLESIKQTDCTLKHTSHVCKRRQFFWMELEELLFCIVFIKLIGLCLLPDTILSEAIQKFYRYRFYCFDFTEWTKLLPRYILSETIYVPYVYV